MSLEDFNIFSIFKFDETRKRKYSSFSVLSHSTDFSYFIFLITLN